jgi:hypothetical protein
VAHAACVPFTVALFTEQLVEANPILTEISDCMTAEGAALSQGDAEGAASWAARKEAANGKLQARAILGHLGLLGALWPY